LLNVTDKGLGFDSRLTVPGGKIPGIKTDQVKVTRSLDRIARFAFGSPQLCASQRLDLGRSSLE
jgi:hypothetical protein